MESLANKYRPHDFDSMCEQSTAVTILKQQIASGEIKNAYLFVGSAGTGKAQPLYSKVLTSNGYISMRDISVGTHVITRKGEIARVTGVYPQGIRPIYEITLQDRTKIRVADNHLNSVYLYNQHKKMREDFVLTTVELIEAIKTSKYKLRIDTPSVDFESQQVLIDPYLLGVLIGDGSLSNNFSFSSIENDIIGNVDYLLRKNYGMCLYKQSDCDYAIKYIMNPKHNGSRGDRGVHPLVRNYDSLTTLKGQLDSYGLLCKSVDKHIPKEYLLNDRETRVRLLQGLYDADGYTSKEGITMFSTSSKQLSDDFAFLVRSLGIRDTVSVKMGKYRKQGVLIETSESYTHYLHMPDDFPYCTSEKHQSRKVNRQFGTVRNIVSIEYVGEEECQCIMVDNPDHTYISDDFIPTHNTTLARIFANEINNGKGNPMELDAASNNSVDDIRNIIQQAKIQSMDSEYRTFVLDEVQALSNNAWQAMLKLLEEPPKKSIFILCTTNPEKIPRTVLSRVQRFDFKRISQQGVIDRLKYILESEKGEGRKLSYTEDAIVYLAKQSDGGLRDAITLLDKCLAYSAELTVNNVIQALGTVDYEVFFELTSAIEAKEENNVIRLIEKVYSDGKDLKQFLKDYLSFLLDINKYDILHNFDYLQLPITYEEELKTTHKEWFDVCRELLPEIVKLNADLKWETQVKVAVEARLLEFIYRR